ncbi:MAG: sn-glycerol-3-phosphate transport system permease protein UgpE [Chloroflexota bacterium]|nr:MAG: sn-glycerol-3-phosphate transport system permease protein UgpE [Chloroflexota bacterium]
MNFLTRTRGRGRLDISDGLTYLYLTLGTVLMFGPVLWLALSSFKEPAQLVRFPPTFLPYRQATVVVEGHDSPLPLYEVALEDGSTQRLAQVRRVGIEAQMIDPANPGDIIRVNINQRTPVETVRFSLDNYIDGVNRFPFWTYFRNSVVVTAAATALTLLINSMAAFALSKYRFRGRDTIFLLTLATLMVPLSVILVPVFLVITQIGWNNNLLGVIVPGAATPTGVFLLRQYMLTIPDELIESARIDGASEWRIFIQIILPLARPALAVLAIFSIMWRWNDFLWPLVVLSRNELFTLQVGLNSFQGELQVQWNLILAMTVLTLLPITLVFGFLQRYITTGIATTGLK